MKAQKRIIILLNADIEDVLTFSNPQIAERTYHTLLKSNNRV
ncbi:hypothetical protein CLV62_12034 [Dysgonomonas alginatilytica]|uniref:Uncharacterized protein n=1 Tax=Dysgonomonas alginatilytica TaxID=1605892 RepID=A0A2V3PLW2_9BACT|nr:hypothetical protein [Dysgonomonas alginatilytica]PXV62346.1 hypothetical protein CLV62_12034 [Dysgonomonas alginatilytica]